MISFLKINKNLFTSALILLIVIPIFGFNFLINFMGNLLLLLLLIPLLIIIISFLSFNSLKSKVKTCSQCGSISLGFNSNCINCGAELDKNNIKKDDLFVNNPGERTIEVKAEEIK